MKRKIALIITGAMLVTGCNITSAGTGNTVNVDLGSVTENTYNITKSGSYMLSGKYKGMISIDTKENVRLILNNADIENGEGPAIYGKNCSRLIIETAEGSNNTLADGTEYKSDGKGCVFSNDDIEISGSGTLNIKAEYDHGIVSDDNVDIESGTVNISAVGDGIHANEDVTVKGGNITISAKQDGIQAEKNVNTEGGTLNITALGEVAESTDNEPRGRGGMFIDGERPPMGERHFADGQFPKMTNEMPPEMPTGKMPEDFKGKMRDMTENTTVASEVNSISESVTETTTEYPSSKGIKADADITIKGGSINISSNDHCIKSANIITIENGSIVLSSPKSKGIKAEGDLIINGGDISIDTKDEAVESKAVATVNGGNINISSEDDGINAGGGSEFGAAENTDEENEHQIIINGGNLYIDAKGDGIDSNGDLYINGGSVIIDGPSDSGNGAIDYAAKGSINGGSLIALGNAGMAQCPDGGEQNTLNITLDEAQKAETSVVIMDSKGNSIGEKVSAKEFQNIIFSSDKIKEGEKYTVYLGDKAALEITANKGVTVYGNAGRGFGRGNFGKRGELPGEMTTK